MKILFGRLFHAAQSWDAMDENLLMGVRFPRTMATVIVGAALALSGVVYQGIFKNPLVSPDFLGVSSGACVGAATAILLSLSAGLVQVFAFFGGILAVTLTLLIPKLLRSDSNIMLVQAGIIVGGAMSSILGFIKYIADPETQLAAITYWQLGSFAYVDNKAVLSVLPLCGLRSPAMQFSSVVLPAPFGPRMQRISPLCKDREILSSTLRRVEGYENVRSFTS